jgi:CDP-6-deoxy-D-xylo-4-hexulose-3-dehydrase
MIKLIKSTFYKEKETKRELIKFIKSAKQLSFGLECQKFEENFARYQGRRYCVFFNSGSSANLAIIQVLLNLGKIKKGDKIGFSVVTWSTNVMPLIQLGFIPVPIDVELTTLNVSSQKLLELLRKEKIKALFLTNLLGFCDDIDEIKRICQKENIILLEDNCESLGTIYKGKKLGNFGIASTFSFYVGHHLSTIEGGMVATDDSEIAEMLKIVRAHGWDRNLKTEEQKKLKEIFKVKSDFFARYTFYDLGYNFRPTEIQGFLGNIQLKYIEEINKKRNQNFIKLAKYIYKKTDKYYPIRFEHIDFVSNFAFPVICKTKEIKDDLLKECEDKVEVRPIVGGDMTKQPFFKKYEKGFSHKNTYNPNASIIHDQGLYFGNNPEITNNEISRIISIFSR